METVTLQDKPQDDNLEQDDTVLVARLDDMLSRFWAASFEAAGYKSQVLEISEKGLATGYNYASGGECMPLVSIVGGVIEKVRQQQLDPKHVYFYLPTTCMACNYPQFPIFASLAFESAGLSGIKVGLINSMTPGDKLPAKVVAKILEVNIVGSIVYKLYHRIKPYEMEKNATDIVLEQSKQKIYNAIVEGKGLRTILSEVKDKFQAIPRDETKGRKPRIALIGDLYVKYNEIVNQRVQDTVDELGGEVVVSSFTEYPLHFFDADIRLHGDSPRSYQSLRRIEQRYEKVVQDLIGEQAEPDFAKCVELMEKYGIGHYIPGETSISIGRALYYIHEQMVDAILHVNPMFCCPGVVTSSIYRKIQRDFDIPIIDIFYDGTGSPNKTLVPHLHYLNIKKGTA